MTIYDTNWAEAEAARRAWMAERAVCSACDATLYWRMRGRKPRSIAVALLDDPSGLKVTEEIFVDYRPGWLPPFEDATQSTEAKEMEKLRKFQAGETQ